MAWHPVLLPIWFTTAPSHSVTEMSAAFPVSPEYKAWISHVCDFPSLLRKALFPQLFEHWLLSFIKWLLFSEAARVSLRCTRDFWLPVHAGCDHMSNCLQKDSQACGYFAFVPTSVSISKSGIGALQRTGVECTSQSGWVWWTHVSWDPLSSSKVRCHECHLSAGWEGGLAPFMC